MLDGNVISDEIINEIPVPNCSESPESIATKKKTKKPNMGFFSALKNSLKNLYYKKGRTIITAIAGCIGVVSISLILALNSGFNAYASNYQKESLSKYPITVNKTQSSIADISGIVSNMSGNDFSTLDTVAIMDILSNDKSNMTAYTEEQIVYIEKLITGVADSLDDLMKENDTTDFKKYVDENFDTSIATVKYDYNLTLNVYNQKVNDSGLTYYSQISPLGTRTANSLESLNSMLSLMGLRLSTNDINNVRAALDNINFWDALVSDENVLNSQYDLLSGR